MILTGKGDETDRILGLELQPGAWSGVRGKVEKFTP